MVAFRVWNVLFPICFLFSIVEAGRTKVKAGDIGSTEVTIFGAAGFRNTTIVPFDTQQHLISDGKSWESMVNQDHLFNWQLIRLEHLRDCGYWLCFYHRRQVRHLGPTSDSFKIGGTTGTANRVEYDLRRHNRPATTRMGRNMFSRQHVLSSFPNASIVSQKAAWHLAGTGVQ